MLQQTTPVESETASVQMVVAERENNQENEEKDHDDIPRMTESELSAELKDIAAQWTPDVSSMAAIPEAATGSSVSRRSKRRADSVDEDMEIRAERIKACRNLEMDFVEGNTHPKSFLQFPDAAFISNFNTVGISLGIDDNSKKESINMLKNIEKDRLKTIHNQDVRSKAIEIEEKELEDTEIVDLLLLNQLCGDITEVLILDSEHIVASTVSEIRNKNNVGRTKQNKST